MAAYSAEKTKRKKCTSYIEEFTTKPRKADDIGIIRNRNTLNNEEHNSIERFNMRARRTTQYHGL
jgi:hypothetical protein